MACSLLEILYNAIAFVRFSERSLHPQRFEIVFRGGGVAGSFWFRSRLCGASDSCDHPSALLLACCFRWLRPVKRPPSSLRQGVIGPQCPVLFAHTLSLVPWQTSQGLTPACPQRGGRERPQPGTHRGPRGGGVSRWHNPAAATTLPGRHFRLLCGLREWAPGLRYAPSPFLGSMSLGP